MKYNIEFTKIPFGKCKGKTFPQAMFIDPDWCFWAFQNDVFAKNPRLQEEVQFVCDRARFIRIPQQGPELMWAEYWLHPKDRSFAMLQLVERSRRPHAGGSETFRTEVIDLSIPYQFKRYDKLGNGLMLKDVRRILFGKKRIRMTKEKCEEFFLNDNNFILS